MAVLLVLRVVVAGEVTPIIVAVGILLVFEAVSFAWTLQQIRHLSRSSNSANVVEATAPRGERDTAEDASGSQS